MAAKLLHSLADDNPDLQKQIGCMTGIFQIFDRQQFLSGRRPNQRRLLPPPPGNSKFNNGSLDDSTNVYNREAEEKNPNKYVLEKQRPSTESSRASFSSSSCSSSFSSLDCGRTGQPEPSSLDRIIFPETPSRDPVISQTSASPKMGRLSFDLRDVVKDSMYRDSRGLSVQTMNKDDGSDYMSKYKDSPRPMQLSKSVDGSLGVGTKGKHNVPADIKESLKVLARLRDAPWHYNEKELPRLSLESKEGSSFSVPRDAPRFSYDGREMSRKVKDLPRLSLDSREISARSSVIDAKLTHLSENMHGGRDDSNERVSHLLQPSRPSSVVARLMGLDTLPDAKPSHENRLGPIRTFIIEDHVPSSVSLRTLDACRPVRLPKSPKSSRKDPTSPRWRNADGIMKPLSSSKFPIEPAPWKQMDGGRVSPKQASKPIKSSTSTSSTSPSVYGEIEKRLKDIEFKQSGKDLRALKQILEAMQAKGLLEDATKEEQNLNLVNKRAGDQRLGSELDAGIMNSNETCNGRAVASRVRGSSTSKASESPIVIMKPAKLVQKSGIPASSIIPVDGLPGLQRPHNDEISTSRKNSASSRIIKEHNSRDTNRDQATTSTDRRTNNRDSRAAQASSRSQQVTKDNTTSSVKNSGPISPRLQQKKLEFDKRSRPPTPPSDSNKIRRQPNRQSSESSSPGGRRRPKASPVQQNDDQLSNESRNLSCQEANMSAQSDATLTSEPRMEITCTTTAQVLPTDTCQNPAMEALKCSLPGVIDGVNLRLTGEDAPGNRCIGPEQPSPVSVLDSSLYIEDSLSPVKQTSHAPEGDALAESNGNFREELWDTIDNLPTETTVLELPCEISRKKLQSIDNLVQKLRRLNSTHDETQTDYIASLCENTNPDYRYISEILLASGLLLRDLSSGLTAFQLHPSGHPINPELFFVLEQTKASSLLAQGDNNPDEVALSKSKPEKFHRKLIFDATNEILTGKLGLVGPPPDPWIKPKKLAKKTLNAQKLLRELCAEIELLQAKKQEFTVEEEEDGLKHILWEDVMHRSGNWTDFQGEVSGIVLDVERHIFKELVDEIVIGEATGRLRAKPNRRCRQLFSK